MINKAAADYLEAGLSELLGAVEKFQGAVRKLTCQPRAELGYTNDGVFVPLDPNAPKCAAPRL